MKEFIHGHMGQKIFPSYKKIGIAKKECYPEKKSCEYSEAKYTVDPKILIKKTVQRILSKISETKSIVSYENKCLDFKIKYGNHFHK